ncbi:MAG TPA: 1-acyl-sn-glycerol-3-phosphate acyltransferase [Candidatus Moranbacteria bacterium]|nr:1-acyl-sn-glycerol-3-phosphate acyltransferase [Candidatus Moranbacteria bacterium]
MKYPKGVDWLGRIYSFITRNLIARIACLLWLKKVEFLSDDAKNPGGNFIVVSNHQSYVDAMLVGFVFKKYFPIFFMDKEYYFNPKLYFFIKRVQQIPTSTDEKDKSAFMAFRVAVDLLSEGNNIFIFPEGAVSFGEVKPFRRGLASLAKRFPDVKIIPVGISNAHGLWDKRHRPKISLDNKRVVVRVGQPIYYRDFTDRDSFLQGIREIVQDLAS